MSTTTISRKQSLLMRFAVLSTAALLLTAASPASAVEELKNDASDRDSRIEALVEASETPEELESGSESHQKRFFGRKFGHRRYGHRHHRYHH